jgi:hypothetical protein
MFRHVVDNAGQPEDEQPRQGALPVLKLVWQPSTQLPEMLSSFASLVMTDVGAANVAVSDVSVVGDDWRGTAPRATVGCRIRLLRFGIWLGASTVTAGRVVEELVADVAACETAMPPGPHVNSAKQEQARARRAKDLMTTSSQCRANSPYPLALNLQGYRARSTRRIVVMSDSCQPSLITGKAASYTGV